jgi:hypothetical protein
MTIEDAVKFLTSTYMPFDVAVRGMEFDPKEIADALANAPEGSEEQTALQFLAMRFPQVLTKKTKE